MKPVLAALTIAVDASDGLASIASLAASLAALDRLPDHLVQRINSLLMGGGDGLGLLLAETIPSAASRTGELHPVRIMPGDDYLELVAALADHGSFHVSWLGHGWPLLSSESVSSVAAASASGEVRHDA